MWKWPEYETLCSKDAKGSLEQSSQLILYKYTSFLSWFNMYLYEFTFNWSVYCLEFSSKYLRMQFKKNFTFNLELKKNMYNLVNVSVFCIMICCSYIETRLMHLYCIKKCLPLVSFFILWCCVKWYLAHLNLCELVLCMIVVSMLFPQGYVQWYLFSTCVNLNCVGMSTW